MIRIAEKFVPDGKPVEAAPYGNGHINETCMVSTDTGHRYILQKLNHHVFRNIPGLMNNMLLVTRHMARKDPDPRHRVTVVSTRDGQPFWQDENGGYWRMLEFIENSFSPENALTPEDLANAGTAFGQFQAVLSDFPAETLVETIPGFHDTPVRYQNLMRAAEEDRMGRAGEVRDLLEFARARERDCHEMTDRVKRGEIPLRVTHNDTKLNNVLFDKESRKPLCVVDLDTVMPGIVANDFGDTIRFGASTAAEDETDLTKVRMSMEYYRAFAEAFLRACGAGLTRQEILTLPWGARLMTLENGMRFLTDYLEGDHYYKISRPSQNLDRARTQFSLVKDMELKWQEMNEVIRSFAEKVGL